MGGRDFLIFKVISYELLMLDQSYINYGCFWIFKVYFQSMLVYGLCFFLWRPQVSATMGG